MRTKEHKGFTIIELLIVLGVLGILSAIVLIALDPLSQLTNAKDVERKAKARELRQAMYQYVIDNGGPPNPVPSGALEAKQICVFGTHDASCVNVDALVPNYIAQLPQDSSEHRVGLSGYSVYESATQQLVVESEHIGTVQEDESISPFAGGEGTSENPYQISTCLELQAISSTEKYLQSNFILKNTINCTASKQWNNGKGFLSIGRFSGTFNGKGYEIQNIYVHEEASGHRGLFSIIDNPASIQNVIVSNVDITGRVVVGGLAGYIGSGVTVENVDVTGSVKAVEDKVGMIAGECWSDVVESSANGSVTGGMGIGRLAAGGLVGHLRGNGTIIRSTSSATVTGEQHVGGLAGLAIGDVQDSFSIGSVTGNSNVGGIVGTGSGETTSQTFTAEISNSYSLGRVTGTSDTGGLVGNANAIGVTVNNSYYNTDTSGQSDTGKGEPKTTNELKAQTTFTGWDFADVWQITEGATYPCHNGDTCPE